MKVQPTACSFEIHLFLKGKPNPLLLYMYIMSETSLIVGLKINLMFFTVRGGKR